MSREQATDQQAQHDTAAPESGATAQTYGLPPALHTQVMMLGPGDSVALRDLLAQNTSFFQQILSVASHHMGNIAVRRAIDMLKASGQGAPPSAKDQAEVMQMFEEVNGPPAAKPAVGKPPSAKDRAEVMQMFEEVNGPPAASGPATATPAVGRPPSAKDRAEVMKLFEEENGPPAAKPAVGRPPSAKDRAEVMQLFEEENGPPAAKPAAEPAWTAGARRFNDAHAEVVAEFNDLTKFKCALDDGIIDPQAVAAWQRQHGVEADGKVGPHTLAAARHAVAKAGPAGVQADARIPV